MQSEVGQAATRVVHVEEVELEPWPLAAEQVLAGAPEASGAIIWRSDDGRLANGVWECTPGVFRWTHVDETALIVRGAVTVTPLGGDVVRLGPGDLVFFPAGTVTEWHVESTVRKGFHLHSADGLGL
jgi:uncharacterized cupin superfamily protein